MAAFDEETRKWVHNTMTANGYDVGTYDQFKEDLNDEETLKWVHENMTNDGYDVGNYDQFKGDVVEVKAPVAENQVPAESVETPAEEIPAADATGTVAEGTGGEAPGTATAVPTWRDEEIEIFGSDNNPVKITRGALFDDEDNVWMQSYAQKMASGKLEEGQKTVYDDMYTRLLQRGLSSDDALKMANSIGMHNVNKQVNEQVKAVLDGVSDGSQDPAGEIESMWSNRQFQNELMRSIQTMGYTYDEYVQKILKPAIRKGAFERFGNKDAVLELNNLPTNWGMVQNTVNMTEAEELVESHLQPYMQEIFNEFDTAKQESLGDNVMTNGAVYPASTDKKAQILETDPQKLLDAVNDNTEVMINQMVEDPAFISEMENLARVAHMAPEDYAAAYISKVISSAIENKFQQMAIARELPKSRLGYYMRGLDDTIVGMVISRLTMSKMRREFRQMAAAQQSYLNENGEEIKAGMIDNALQMATTMAGDFWLWGGWGKVGGKVAESLLLERIAATAIKNRVSMAVARQIMIEEAEQSLGKRIAGKILQHMPASMITMGGAEGTTAIFQGIRDEKSAGDIMADATKRTASGMLTGAAFTLTGSAAHEVTKVLSPAMAKWAGGLAEKLGLSEAQAVTLQSKVAPVFNLLGKAGAYEVEAGTMYTTEELQKMANGEEGFENPFEGLVEANAKLGLGVKLPNAVTSGRFVHAMTHPVDAVKSLFASAENGNILTKDDVASLMEGKTGTDLVDALSEMRPSDEKYDGERYGERYESWEKESLQRAAEAYDAYMADSEIPWDRKVRVARVLGGKALDFPKAEASYKRDGLTIKTYDEDGMCVEELTFADKAEADAWEERNKNYFLAKEMMRAEGKVSGTVAETEETAKSVETPAVEVVAVADATDTGAEPTEREVKAQERAKVVRGSSADAMQLQAEAIENAMRIKTVFADAESPASKAARDIMSAIDNGKSEAEVDELFAFHQSRLTDEQRALLEQYRDINDIDNAVDAAIYDEVEQEALERRQALERCAVEGRPDTLIPLTLNGGKVVYYKKGDLENEWGQIIVVEQDGSNPHPIPRQNIAEIGEEVSLSADVEVFRQGLADQKKAEYDARTSGQILERGQKVQFEQSGEIFDATVGGLMPDGTVLVTLGDGTPLQMTRVELSDGIMRANSLRVQNAIAEEGAARRQAEAERKAQEALERRQKGIAGFMEGQVDWSNPGNDPVTTAEYMNELMEGKDRKASLDKMQKSIDAEVQRAKRAQYDLQRQRQWMEANGDMYSPDELQAKLQVIAKAESDIADAQGRAQMWAKVRDAYMTPEEKQELVGKRRDVTLGALDEARKMTSGEALGPAEKREPIPTKEQLLEQYETETEADIALTQRREALKKEAGESVTSELADIQTRMREYENGMIELGADEIKTMAARATELEQMQDILNAESKALKSLKSRLPQIYKERNDAMLDAHEKGLLKAEKATNPQKKVEALREAYADDEMAQQVFDDSNMEPRDIEEYVASMLRPRSLNWESVQEEVFPGVTRKIGRDSESQRIGLFLANKGEGASINEIAHEIWESAPDIDGERIYSDTDIRNTLIDLLRNAESAKDISERVLRNRMEEAEDIYQENLRREQEEQEAAQGVGTRADDKAERIAQALEGAELRIEKNEERVERGKGYVGRTFDSGDSTLTVKAVGATGELTVEVRYDNGAVERTIGVDEFEGLMSEMLTEKDPIAFHDDDMPFMLDTSKMQNKAVERVDKQTKSLIDEFAQASGRRVIFLSDKQIKLLHGVDARGYWSPKLNAIVLNVDRNRGAQALYEVMGHEATHVLARDRRSGESFEKDRIWNTFQSFVRESMGAEEYDRRFAERKAEYEEAKNATLPDAYIHEEICGDWAAENIFTDADSVRELVDRLSQHEEASTIIQKILSLITRMQERMKALVKSGNATYAQYQALSNAKTLWEEMYRYSAAKQHEKLGERDKVSGDEVQNMLVTDKDEIQFMFVGEKGAENDKSRDGIDRMTRLTVARDMEKKFLQSELPKNEEPMEVWKKNKLAIKWATGWERGVDGRWRSEEPDLELRNAGWKTLHDGKRRLGFLGRKNKESGDIMSLKDLIDAPYLFTLYPDMKDIRIVKTDDKVHLGGYRRSDNTIEISNGLLNFSNDIDSVKELLRYTLIHEVQHVIQTKEGFAKGSNPSMFEQAAIAHLNMYRATEKMMQEYGFMPWMIHQEEGDEVDQMASTLPEGRQMWAHMIVWARHQPEPWRAEIEKVIRATMHQQDLLWSELGGETARDTAVISPRKAYTNTAGEIEARDASERADWSEEERRSTLAGATQDVAWRDQILLFDKAGIIANGEITPDADAIQFMFVGEKGAQNDKTQEGIARMQTLTIARDMEQKLARRELAEGEDREEAEKRNMRAIKWATGWERGADGKWRHEEQDLRVKKDEWKSWEQWDGQEDAENGIDDMVMLGQLVDAPELFAMYPEAYDMPVIKKYDMDGRVAGRYNPIENTIYLNKALDRWVDVGADDVNMEAMENTLMHEIQHYIQRKEGFATGGNVKMFEEAFRKTQDLFSTALQELGRIGYDFKDADKSKTFSIMAELPSDRRQWAPMLAWADSLPWKEKTTVMGFLNNSMDEIDRTWEAVGGENAKEAFLHGERGAYTAYKNLAGEVEARNTEKRAYWSDERRRSTLAEQTEDVDREDQIFLFDAAGVNKSEEPQFMLDEKEKDEAIKRIDERIAELNRLSEDELLTITNIGGDYEYSEGGHPTNDGGANRVSSSGAKVGKKFGSAKLLAKNLSTFIEKSAESLKPETFAKDMAVAMTGHSSGFDSEYINVDSNNEKLRIRLSDHSGNALSIIRKGKHADKGYSFVVKYEGMPEEKRKTNFQKKAKRNLYVVEFVYDNPDNERMVNIAKGVFNLLDTGEYLDIAGADEITPTPYAERTMDAEAQKNIPIKDMSSLMEEVNRRKGLTDVEASETGADGISFMLDNADTTDAANREAWEKAKYGSANPKGIVLMKDAGGFITFGSDARKVAKELGRETEDGKIRLTMGDYLKIKDKHTDDSFDIKQEHWSDWEDWQHGEADEAWKGGRLLKKNVMGALQAHPELIREREAIKTAETAEEQMEAIDDYVQTLSDMLDGMREDLSVQKGARPALLEAISEANKMREKVEGAGAPVEAAFGVDAWKPKAQRKTAGNSGKTQQKTAGNKGKRTGQKTQKEWQKTAPSDEDIVKNIWADPQSEDFSTGEYYDGDNQELARAVKRGETGAIKEAARRMSKYIEYYMDGTSDEPQPMDEWSQKQNREATVLIPVPSHTGKATYTLKLAQELSKLTGIPVANALSSKPYESSYERKAREEKPEVPEFDFTLDYDIQNQVRDAQVILLIDNVEATGDTMTEAEYAVSGMTSGSIARFPFVKDSSKVLKIGEKDVLLSGDEANTIRWQARTLPKASIVRGKHVSENWKEWYEAGLQDAETVDDLQQWLDYFPNEGRTELEGQAWEQGLSDDVFNERIEAWIQAFRDKLAGVDGNAEASIVKPWENVQTATVHSSNIRRRFPQLHESAKGGDVKDAFRLVDEVVDMKKIAMLKNQYPDAMVAFPHAEYTAGRNAIPAAFADKFAVAGFDVDGEIVQTNRVYRTDANKFDRLLRRARFAGDVEAGREYILIDDHITSGATMRDMKDYIESKGGKVVAIQALEGSAGATNIALSDELKVQLTEQGITDEQIRELGISRSVENLTAGEARELLTLSKRGRDFRSKEQQKISSRGNAKNQRRRKQEDTGAEESRAVSERERIEAEKQRFAELFGVGLDEIEAPQTAPQPPKGEDITQQKTAGNRDQRRSAGDGGKAGKEQSLRFKQDEVEETAFSDTGRMGKGKQLMLDFPATNEEAQATMQDVRGYLNGDGNEGGKIMLEKMHYIQRGIIDANPEWRKAILALTEPQWEYYKANVVGAFKEVARLFNEGTKKYPVPDYYTDRDVFQIAQMFVEPWNYEAHDNPEDEKMYLERMRNNPKVKTIYSDQIDPKYFKLPSEQDVQFMLDLGDVERADPFYSNAAKTVEGIRQEKATPEQWLAMITKAGGLKKGEDKWIGLSEWLRAQQMTAGNEGKAKTLTKREVMDYIKEHAIKLEEVQYSDRVQAAQYGSRESFEDQAEFNDIVKDSDEFKKLDQKFRERVEESGEYEEDVFREMSLDYEDFDSAFEVGWDGLDVIDPYKAAEILGVDLYKNADLVVEDNPINSTRLQYTTDGLGNKKEIALTVPTITPWHENDEIHFGDAGEGRAIGWIRFGDAETGDGSRVLVIDEIQSNRHQEGREKGYRPEVNPEDIVLEYADDGSNYVKATWNGREEGIRRTFESDDAARKYFASVFESGNGVPDAPFDKNWMELGMKRMLRYAAENGYDKVAWTTGKQQAERYNLAKVLDSAELLSSDDKQRIYDVIDKSGGRFRMKVDDEGRIIESDLNGVNKGMLLSDVMGKDIADKMSELDVNDDNEGMMSFDDLSVGGEGMKGFYDQMLPKFMSKYGKKWGATVGEVELDLPNSADRVMHAVDVTPSMVRDVVLEGQPMFMLDETSPSPSEGGGVEPDGDMMSRIMREVERRKALTGAEGAGVPADDGKPNPLSRGDARRKPRKKKDENMGQYLERLREWERWHRAEREARENNDPQPLKEMYDKVGQEEFEKAMMQWKADHPEIGDDIDAGAFPRREKGESPQDYAKRVSDYEEKKDVLGTMPNPFEYEKKADEAYHKAYEEWKRKYYGEEKQDIADIILGGEKVEDPDAEIEARVDEDVDGEVGNAVTAKVAQSDTRMAVIERRKNLESRNSADGVWLYDFVKRTDEIAKRMTEENSSGTVVTGKMIREALPDMIEGMYGTEIQIDENGEPVFIQSENMPLDPEHPELKALMKDIKAWYDEFFSAMEETGLRRDAGYIEEGYVNHIWDREKSDPEAWEKYVENRQRTTSSNMKHREIMTYEEGRALGLVPKYTDIRDIMADYSKKNNEAIANRQMLIDLSGISVAQYNKDGEVVLQLPLITSKKPDNIVEDNYSVIEHVAGVGTVWVHKAAADNFKVVFEQNEIPAWLGLIDKQASVMKTAELALSGFHMGALSEVFLVQNMISFGPAKAGKAFFKVTNPVAFYDTVFKGENIAMRTPELFKDAAKHLVKLGATDDYAAKDVVAMTERFRNIMRGWWNEGNYAQKGASVAGIPIATMMDWINKGFDRALWNWLHDGYKLESYRLFSQAIRDRAEKEDWSQDQLDRQLDEAGQYVNDMFGGQHWDVLGISPKSLRWMRRGLLSPDWFMSTSRHALAMGGVGSIYGEPAYKKWAKFVKKETGEEPEGVRTPGMVADQKGVGFRERNAWACYGLGVMGFTLAIMNGLNAFFRKWDEEEEKRKADEIRQTNPDYKSPYELAYPDGMKPWDYTMFGNAPGHKTHLFMGPRLDEEKTGTLGKLWNRIGGRYEDGGEMYVRWGKQFRELPEFFMNEKGEFELGAPIVKRMIGKSNPLVGLTVDEIQLATNPSYQDKELIKKHGRSFAMLYKAVQKYMPFGFSGTGSSKEYKGADFVFPSSKGFSNYKAQEYFKDAFANGDWELFEQTYRACQQNGIDAEKQMKAARSAVEAALKENAVEGVVDVQTAVQAYDEATTLGMKKKLRTMVYGFLSQEEYRAFTLEEARENLEDYLGGGDAKELVKVNDKYLMQATGDDIVEDWRLSMQIKNLKVVCDALDELTGELKTQFKAEHKEELDEYKKLVGVRKKIGKLKKKLDKDPEAMEKIRKERRKAVN